jgi:dephospho-CoA kinase
MLMVGLTGGIGSGKSTVAGLLAARGAVVIDADAIAREVVEPGQPALAALVERFGAEILEPGGRLDRAELAVRAELAGPSLANVRVRDLGEDRARVEVDRELLDELLRDDSPIIAAVRGAGFERVEIDPRGFRSGAMNELLPQPELYR